MAALPLSAGLCCRFQHRQPRQQFQLRARHSWALCACRGLAVCQLKTKRDVDQAPALTVAQLRWLEYFAATADDLYRRLVVSTLFFIVHTRIPRSDLSTLIST